ncbi:Probable aspartic protease At2g35615 [Linum perenne]
MPPTIASIIITAFLFYSINSLTHSHGLKIKTRLIHRDSVYSPLYNASLTTEDRAERTVQSCLARLAYLSSKNTPSGIEALLVLPTKFNVFYVNFSIGQPPVPQIAIMDTGSDVTWVKCLPCNPCKTIPGATLFDPLKSKTYRPRPCTQSCSNCTVLFLLWNAGLRPRRYCLYDIYYAGGDQSEGIYATDQLTFRTADDGLVTIPYIQFGCTSLLTGPSAGDDKILNGILGLGANGRTPSDEPLITKLGSKFSYCIGSVLDRSYLYNHLTISDDADLLGFSTPFYSNKNGDYFVHLTNISLGDSTLNISDEVFRKMSKEGIMVDSGTEVMFLHEEAFEVVKAEVKKLGSSNLTETRSKSGLELCYKGLVNVDARDQFPNMDLQFKDGADLLIDNTGMFIQVDDNTFCLAVIRTKGVSIIGVMAQQGYNVGYDLKGSRIYFQDLDCQILEARKF